MANEVEIEEVNIYDETGELLINFADETVAGKLSLGTIEIIESIAETSVNGVLNVDASRGEIEALQLSGNEKIQFTFKSTKDSEEDFVLQTPMFRIYDADDSSYFSDLALTPEGMYSRALTIKFTSIQSGDIFNTQDPLPEGFVGMISTSEDITPEEEEPEIEGPPEPEPEEEDGDDDDVKITGLINELAKTYFPNEKFYIEGTDNSVMLPTRRFSFPTRKMTKNMNLLELINYCAKYAWKSGQVIEGPPEPGDAPSNGGSERGWCNYFFWQDLDGWHFESVARKAIGKAPKKTFTFQDDVLGEQRITKLDVISDFSVKKAFSDGMLYSFLHRVEPNYNNFYDRFLDDENKYIESKYTFNYGKDYSPIIGDKRFLADVLYDDGAEQGEVELEQWLESKENEDLEIKDKIYGHYDNRQHRDKEELYRIVGKGYDKNAPGLGKFNLLPEISKETVDYTFYQSNMFQEMFDCVEILKDIPYRDVDILKRIHIIKANTFRAKALYRFTLNYKEKWNIYRHSVCCDSQTESGSDFFAVVKEHKKIGENIYRYSWAKVAIIPKAEIDTIIAYKYFATDEEFNDPILSALGVTSELAFYTRDTAGYTGLNSMFLWDDYGEIYYQPHWLMESGAGIGARAGSEDSDGNPQFNTNPVGVWSGKIYFAPFGGVTAPQGPTGSISFPFVKDLLSAPSGETAQGVTLIFHNDQYSPFLVVEQEPGIRGVLTNSSCAYNLNEVLNRQTRPVEDDPLPEPSEGDWPAEKYPEYFGTSGESGGFPVSGNTYSSGIVYNQRSKMDYPLLSVSFNEQDSFDAPTETFEELIGPGIQGTGASGAGYPDGFDMIPVGGYKRLDENNIPVCKATAFGHVVKMSSFSYQDALEMGIQPRDYPKEVSSKRFYYFSVENGHDGSCNGECDL